MSEHFNLIKRAMQMAVVPAHAYSHFCGCPNCCTERDKRQKSGPGSPVVSDYGKSMAYSKEYMLHILKEDVSNNIESEASAFFIERFLKRFK